MYDKRTVQLQVFFMSLLLLMGSLRPAHGRQIPDTLQFHGFASQGFILSSKNNFFGESEDGSLDFRELGLNASIRPLPDLQLSLQILSRRAGKKGNDDIRLDYALLDYSVISDESGNFGIRIGRIKNPIGLYNDTRDVAFTRPSIFLPQSIYFDRARNLALSADGINFYTDLRTDVGDLFYQFELVYPDVDDIQTKQTLLGKQPGKLDRKLSYVGRLIFEREGGKMRLGVTGVVLNIGFESKSAGMKDGRIRFQPFILSAQYNAEFWSLTSEYALRYFRYQDVGAIPDFGTTGESYYLQGTYRFATKLEALLRYDVLYQDKDDRSGKKFTRGPSHTRFAKDLTLGLKWSMTKAWMSRIEFHNVDGTAWLPSLDNPGPLSALKRRWTMWALLVSYRF